MPGTPQQCTSISISDDAILENDEIFSLQLNTTDQAVTLRRISANVTIGDDDRKSFLAYVYNRLMIETLFIDSPQG